ncbi:MAG: AMP-binding protein, partial [Myxococcales bacterium]|nr:AMP-binding protein [Myxococcales bacterium]
MANPLISMALAPRAARPAAEAMVHGPRRFTWDELGDYVDRAAAVLQAHGVGPGAVVANQQGKAIEEVVVVLAAARLGATPLNLHPTLTAPQVAEALARSGAHTLVLHRARVRPLAAALTAPGLRLLVTIGQPLGPDCPFVPPSLAVQHLLDGVKITPPLQAVIPAATPAAWHVALGLAGAPVEAWDADGLAAEARALAAALGLGPSARLLSVIPFSTRPGLVSLLAAGISRATTHLQ